MQTLAGEGGYYFAYIENLRKVLVWKDNKPKYIVETDNFITCNCPGSIFHGHCKHVDFVTSEFNLNRVIKPRLPIYQWEEEYYQEFLQREVLWH